MVLVAAAAAAVFGTQAHQHSSPAALAAIAAIGAFVGVLIAVGLPSEPAGGVREWLPAVLAGAAGLAVAPWLVMANRYTDAPPGSEVMFLTTSAWGAMLALALAALSRERVSRAGGALLALAGAATLVANWERPSSFSLFVRFVREEALMLLAGVLWTALVLVLLRAARRGSLGTAALAAALGGLGGAGVLAALAASAGAVAAPDFTAPGAWGFGIATAFAVAGMLVALRSGSAGGVAGAYLLAPAAVSLLLVVEQFVGPLGPQPFVVAPALAAIVCMAAGVALTSAWAARGPSGAYAESALEASRAAGGTAQRRSRALTHAGRVAGSIAVAAALADLATPAMTATVEGLRADGAAYRASFSLFGWEVAGPWLALGIAVAALGVALVRSSARPAVRAACAIVAAAAAWWVAASTPLRTLTSFIPSDVQVDYGSEFARISFASGSVTLGWVAIGGALLAVALGLFGQRRAAPPGT